MLRSKNVIPCVPIPEEHLKREFIVASEVEEKVPLYDKDGKVVSEQVVNVPIRKSIPKEQWEHRGEDCSLFSIDNQIKSGVSLSEFHGAFISPSLAESSYLGEQAIKQINARLESEKSNVESSKTE